MKSWFLQVAFDIRHSYWFIPSLMALGAIVLAAGMVAVDIYYLNDIPKGYEWLFRSQPDGARALLSTVAGSTITVAGVVFSMTIMAVSHATSNYGSRLLLKFLQDRLNQVALGTFTATFIYCLLVLRTISSAGADGGVASFVPHLAVLGALGMALASVAVLIMFIHHVPDTIHVADVAADRGSELIERLQNMFPATDQYSESGNYLLTPHTLKNGLGSEQSGYFQALDIDGLIKCCRNHNLVVKLLKRPGDFVRKGEIFIRYDGDTTQERSEIVKDVLSTVGIGRERTPAQDIRYVIEELNQVSARALSPGINDPFTAITCIDWLSGALTNIANRGSPVYRYHDKDDTLRLILVPTTFEDVCNWIFATNRLYVVKDRNVLLHMATVFESVVSCTINDGHKAIIVKHAQAYKDEALQNCTSDVDRDEISREFNRTLRQN